MDKLQLIKEIQDGAIDPTAAIERFEMAGVRHISEVDVTQLRIDVLDCGFPTLNEYMVFKRSSPELVVIGARPSMGKSALMFQIARHVAEASNVLIFSMEMDLQSIKSRMVASESGIGLTRIQRGQTEGAALKAIIEAAKHIDKLKYLVVEQTYIDIDTIVSKARDVHRRRPLGMVVVDYLQKIQIPQGSSANHEIGVITTKLKSLAKELGCPVLIGSQLSRQVDWRGKQSGDYVPILSDLRDSGSIEADADVVVFISQQFKYDGSRPGEADINVAKNRNGVTGKAVFKFMGGSTKFLDDGVDAL
jgi:replicative DNA helicase